MTTKLQNAIIAGSIIGSLLSNYNPNETNKNLKQIRADIKKMMYRRSRSNKKEFVEAIAIADKAWSDTINHFTKINEQMPIEALNSVMRLYNLYAEPLKRFANISEKKMEKLMFKIEERVSQEHENNSFEAIDFLLDRLSESTGVNTDKGLKTKLAIIKGNIITERG